MSSYLQHIVSCRTARALVEAAISHADSNGWQVACVVLDPAGHVVASARMDAVKAAILDIAIDKAYTASLGKSSYAMFERMHSSPALELGLVNRPRFCVWQGGLPIYQRQADNDSAMLIGSIGVSGAAGPDDVSCAENALKQLGLYSEASVTSPSG